HAADEEPRRIAEERAHHLVGAPRLELLRPVGAGDDAEREQRKACDEEAMLRVIERIERRQAAEARRVALRFDTTLLHEVEHRRAACEEEEGDAEQIRDDVERDEDGAEPRLRRGLAEEVRSEQERETERAHQEAERVDAEAPSKREVRRRRKKRRD